jgi:hypothetical protein
MPWGIALNSQTKECGEFWGGDEYAAYILSNQWKIYYPESNGLVQTEVGNCTLSEGIEYCCRQLGYTYISGNVGAERGYKVWTLFTWILLLYKLMPLILLILAIIIVNRILKSRKKSDTSGSE